MSLRPPIPGKSESGIWMGMGIGGSVPCSGPVRPRPGAGEVDSSDVPWVGSDRELLTYVVVAEKVAEQQRTILRGAVPAAGRTVTSPAKVPHRQKRLQRATAPPCHGVQGC